MRNIKRLVVMRTKLEAIASLTVIVLALAGSLSLPAEAQNIGQLVDISRPNAVGSCE